MMIKVHFAALVALGALAACKNEQPTEVHLNTAKSVAWTTRSSGVSSAGTASGASSEGGELPKEWGPLPDKKAPTSMPKVTAFTKSSTPTLLLFFATWCGPCVGSLLSDNDLKRRFSPKVRVGLVLHDDSDEHFDEFSKSFGASLNLEVWREDGELTALAEKCEVRSIPHACLIDENANVLWSGPGPDAGRMADAAANGKVAEAISTMDDARAAIKAALAQPDDDKLRAKALELSRGMGGTENSVAWDLAERGDALDLAIGLARDATISTGGLDYATLDTYGLALWNRGRKEEAFAVQSRAMAVCDVVGPKTCGEERGRYERFKSELGK
jgi:hypothetical protein